MVDSVIEAFNWFRDGLYQLLKVYQSLVEPVLGDQSYWFAIVMLTVTIRALLIPLTVKQVRSQRAMAEIAPEMKKLQAKHKDDRQRLNEEMMKLYQERGANPMMGCLPLLAQAPFFLAIYHVIYQKELAGEPNILLNHGFFGIPMDATWWGMDSWADRFLSVQGLVIVVLIVGMATVQSISMRQMMAKQGQNGMGNAQAQQMQQTMVKFMPIMFAVIGVNFPLAVLIYWSTTNLWQWGQQTVMLRTHPMPDTSAAKEKASDEATEKKSGTKAKASAGSKGGKQPERPKGFFANLMAQANEAAAAQQQRNGSSSKNGTARSSSTKKSGGDGQTGAGGTGKGTKATQGAGTARSRSSSSSSSSSTGRKTASSSKSGGGKGGASSRQRRRKR